MLLLPNGSPLDLFRFLVAWRLRCRRCWVQPEYEQESALPWEFTDRVTGLK